MKVIVKLLPKPDAQGCRWELSLVENHADGAAKKDVATHRWTSRTREHAEDNARRFARNFECAAVLIEPTGKEVLLT